MEPFKAYRQKKEHWRQVRSWCKRYLTVDLCAAISDALAGHPKHIQYITYKATNSLQEYLDYNPDIRLTGMDPAEEAGTIMCGYLANLFQKKLNEYREYYDPINRAFMARVAPVRNARVEQAKSVEKIPGIHEYTSREDLGKDLKYWCNGLGELHFHGQYDITKEELPKPLRHAYENLLTDACGSICYLVDYKDEYFIALVNEFEYFITLANESEENGQGNEAVFHAMREKARLFRQLHEFRDAIILLGENTGISCHEFITLLPAGTDKETFSQVASILRNNL